jgi:hypothetical protein
MNIDGRIPGGPTYLPPPTFQFFSQGRDFPAKADLKTVLSFVAGQKQRRMAEVDFYEALYELGLFELDDLEDITPAEINQRYPKYAVWFTFDMGLDDLPGSPPVDTFGIELVEVNRFVDSDEHTETSVIDVIMTCGYDAIGIMFRYIREPEALFCECNIKAFQGDGQEVTALARHLERQT